MNYLIELIFQLHLCKAKYETFHWKNTFENVVWKMAPILSRPQRVKGSFFLNQDCHSLSDKMVIHRARLNIKTVFPESLRWRHNGCDSVSNHQPHHCLRNRLFRRRSKTSGVRCCFWLNLSFDLTPHKTYLNFWLKSEIRLKSETAPHPRAPRHWPLCGEFPGDRWIPRTNGQLRGKCFHLMTSSWWGFSC